jgi:hypothetical protein
MFSIWSVYSLLCPSACLTHLADEADQGGEQAQRQQEVKSAFNGQLGIFAPYTCLTISTK